MRGWVVLVVLLTGCASQPVVLGPSQDIVELPVRPQPGEVRSQRDVARFIVALSAYADELEARLKALGGGQPPAPAVRQSPERP